MTVVITFALIRNDNGKTYSVEKMTLGFKQILKTSSQQVTFSRNLLKLHGIQFDEMLGSGTGNGGGEENKFRLDWRKSKAKMLYYPDIIATVNPGESQWFHGYDEKFFYNLGWTDRRVFGPVLGLIYIIYWPIFRRGYYSKRSNISTFTALKAGIKGYFSKR